MCVYACLFDGWSAVEEGRSLFFLSFVFLELLFLSFEIQRCGLYDLMRSNAQTYMIYLQSWALKSWALWSNAVAYTISWDLMHRLIWSISSLELWKSWALKRERQPGWIGTELLKVVEFRRDSARVGQSRRDFFQIFFFSKNFYKFGRNYWI